MEARLRVLAMLLHVMLRLLLLLERPWMMMLAVMLVARMVLEVLGLCMVLLLMVVLLLMEVACLSTMHGLLHHLMASTCHLLWLLRLLLGPVEVLLLLLLLIEHVIVRLLMLLAKAWLLHFLISS